MSNSISNPGHEYRYAGKVLPGFAMLTLLLTFLLVSIIVPLLIWAESLSLIHISEPTRRP